MTNRPAKDSRGLSKLPNFGKPGGAISTGYRFEETVSAQVLEKARGTDKKSPVLAGREIQIRLGFIAGGGAVRGGENGIRTNALIDVFA